mgnify:CR=1 FL=1
MSKKKFDRYSLKDMLIEEKDNVLLLPGDEGYENPGGDDPLSRKKYDTVGEALEDLKNIRAEQKTNRWLGQLWGVVKEIPKASPEYGAILAGIGKLYDVWNFNKNKDIPPGAEQDSLSNYPFLDLFDIHSAFFEILDDDILEKIKNEFSSKYVMNLTAGTKMSSIPDINEFIPWYIKSHFGVNIEIDTSMETVH